VPPRRQLQRRSVLAAAVAPPESNSDFFSRWFIRKERDRNFKPSAGQLLSSQVGQAEIGCPLGRQFRIPDRKHLFHQVGRFLQGQGLLIRRPPLLGHASEGLGHQSRRRAQQHQGHQGLGDRKRGPSLAGT
jgi:hypothetical protein